MSLYSGKLSTRSDSCRKRCGDSVSDMLTVEYSLGFGAEEEHDANANASKIHKHSKHYLKLGIKLKERFQVTIMVTVIITSFVICNAPGAILYLLTLNHVISRKVGRLSCLFVH
ncbi:hypothetical protein COOONC_18337 [Cooperia oncophora]